MPSLRELQQRAYRAIVLEEDGVFVPVVCDIRAAAARLDVYRNNAREAFHKTLAATYPVVQRLVGEQCFRSIAHSYLRNSPSRSGDLGRYGAELPTLLDVYYRDTGFAYLADVARLEWAVAEVEVAADALSFDVLSLAQVPSDMYADVRFTLRAPVRLVSSLFPVFSIWEANQRDEVRPVTLSSGAEHVLVTRRARGVELFRVDAGVFAFARSLGDGESVADAVAAGDAAAVDFDTAGALATLVRLDAIAGFRLPADEIQ